MKIELGGKWQIVSDGNQFILNENKTIVSKDTGESRQEWVWNGYYSSIDSCLSMLPNKMALRSDATTLGQLLEEMREFRRIIEQNFQTTQPCKITRMRRA